MWLIEIVLSIFGINLGEKAVEMRRDEKALSRRKKTIGLAGEAPGQVRPEDRRRRPSWFWPTMLIFGGLGGIFISAILARPDFEVVVGLLFLTATTSFVAGAVWFTVVAVRHTREKQRKM